MTRRLLTILAIVSLLVLTVASPAAAGRRWDKPAPPVREQVANNCNTNFSPANTYFDGYNISSPTSYSGAQADIDPAAASAFHICLNPNVLDLDDAVSAWVAITPQMDYDPSCPDAWNCIMQIGIIECDAIYTDSECAGDSHPHYFWARAGCAGTQPFPIDLGPADYASHHYEIYKTRINGADYWKFTIDYGAIASFTTSVNHVNIACWASNGHHVQSTYMFERHDHGDSTGNSNALSWIDNIRYGLEGSGWFTPGDMVGTCYTKAPDAVCQGVGGDSFYAYSS